MRITKLIHKVLAVSVGVVLITALSAAYIIRNESKDFKLQKNLDIFYSLVRELNAFYVDDIDPDKLIKESIDEMLNDLDPYTVYYPESEINDFKFMTTGKYGGVGSLIRRGGEYTVLTQIYKGFPADKAGLKAGDLLKAIDGESLKNLSTEEVSSRLKGDPNTNATLTIERQGKEFDKTITRKKIAIPPVPYFGMLNNETGYIRFTNFTQNCSGDVKNALNSLLENNNAKKIILDVRNNPGGLVTEAVEIVNFFVGPGHEVLSTKGRVEKYDHVYKTNKAAIDEDVALVVMINRNTASAAEILAGAIQDLDRGIVVGQRSYGKGLVQISRPLSYNTTLKVTTAKYYIPSGRCVQALDFSHRNEDGSVGFIPDSLISEFYTKNGRVVKDGGGITPDYIAKNEQLSQFSTELFLRSLIFDYATSYYWDHPEIDQPGEFVLDDESYDDFSEFLTEKEFTYKSATEDALNRLSLMAKREKYYDINQELFIELKEKLSHTLGNDLVAFRKEVISLLEDEIIGRYYYEDGLIRHSIVDDKQIAKALEIIMDNNIYASTLKGHSGLLSKKD